MLKTLTLFNTILLLMSVLFCLITFVFILFNGQGIDGSPLIVELGSKAALIVLLSSFSLSILNAAKEWRTKHALSLSHVFTLIAWIAMLSFWAGIAFTNNLKKQNSCDRYNNFACMKQYEK